MEEQKLNPIVQGVVDRLASRIAALEVDKAVLESRFQAYVDAWPKTEGTDEPE